MDPALPIPDGVLDALADRIAERLPTPSPPPTSKAQEEGTICGLDPHALYSVSDVAERWSKSETTVRRMEEEGTLPRVEWKGHGVRFRGVDILRVEGVDIDTTSPDSSSAPSATPRGDGAASASLPEL